MMDLLTLLRPPAAYAKSGEPFWDDEHISQQMLYAHLDPSIDAASRRPEFIDASVAWMRGLAPPQEYPKLIDLGCGPGLYAERLARAGYEVTGVDLSRRSIAYATESARQQGLAINYQRRDYLDAGLPPGFDTAIMIFCDYGVLGVSDRARLMRNAYDCLRPGGLFLLDEFSMASFERFEERRWWDVHEGGGFWSAQDHLILCENRKYDGHITLEQRVVVTRSSAQPYYIWNTCFDEARLAGEARAAGFAVEAFFGDVAGAPPSGSSETLAAVLRRPF